MDAAAGSGPAGGGGLGGAGERLAAAFLARAGYRVLQQNVRTRGGEIDLLVRRRRTLIAVEVKTRSHLQAPERAVDDRAVERLARALAALAPVAAPWARELRVDVVAVSWPRDGAPDVRHFPGTPFTAPAGG